MIGNVNRPYFTEAFTRKVQHALEQNRSEPRDIYHHPSEKRIVAKCISLSCQKPLHAADSDHPRSSSDEKWLEAYLIRQAKRNNWILELAGRDYHFLYSQLNFRAEGTKPPRPLDVLLCEKETHHLVILELKAKRELGRAREELGYYSTRLNSLKGEIGEVFNLERIPGVRGYIVWPKGERGNNDRHDFGLFGVIEYTKVAKPWEKFKESGEDLRIDFSRVRESQIIN